MTDPPFKLGLLVMAHGMPEQLADTLSLLRDPRIVVYLHLDSRAPLRPFRAALERARVENVVWLKRRRTSWGYVSIIDAELEGLARATNDGCGYVLTISGQDVPLMKASELVEFAFENRTRSFVQAVPLADNRWPYEGRFRTDFYSYRLFGQMYTCVPRGEEISPVSAHGIAHNVRGAALNAVLRTWSSFKPDRRFPSYLEPYGGQHWMNLSAGAVSYVLRFVGDHPGYRRYHQHTTCADEIFLQSIIWGSQFADDHEIINDDLRFQLWKPRAPHPEMLKLDDLPAILASDDLFARKLVRESEPELFAQLRRRVSGTSA